MICIKCGKDLKETDKFCSKCGCAVQSEIPHTDLIKSDIEKAIPVNTNKDYKVINSKKPHSNNKSIYNAVSSIVFIIMLLIGLTAILSNNSNFKNSELYSYITSIFSNDEKEIVGTWKLDTSSFGEGLEGLANLNGVITGIEFYSDGTCTVDGLSSPESGVWSIVDGQLRVQGTTGGVFWNYHGFISEYDLKGDALTVYGNNGDNYVYYRE